MWDLACQVMGLIHFKPWVYHTTRGQLCWWCIIAALDAHEIWIFYSFFTYTWGAITWKYVDIYLKPLIDEIKLLWDSSFETYDTSGIKLFKCGQLLCGLSTTFLHMLRYLVRVQKEIVLHLVVTMSLILAILNIVVKCVIWIIMFFWRWIIHRDLTKDLSMEKLNSGLLHFY